MNLNFPPHKVMMMAKALKLVLHVQANGITMHYDSNFVIYIDSHKGELKNRHGPWQWVEQPNIQELAKLVHSARSQACYALSRKHPT